MKQTIQESDFLLYAGEDGKINAQVIVGDETVWVSQKTMSEMFGVGVPDISKHLNSIFDQGELEKEATISKLEIVQIEGTRKVKRAIEFYNLDAAIAVGYRVNSFKATRFRQWATRVLKEYLIKGFVLDDERLKQGNKLFGKDYFRELLEKIREIRASEKLFYEKVTELYATSVDYDKNDPATHKFFAKVQAKLEFAIVGKTPSEIIKSRANYSYPNMGLTTWKNVKKDGNILLSDVKIAKNYLTKDEISSLNLLVSAFLEHAEMLVSRNRLMKMADWSERLDSFINFNEYKVLKDAGKVSKDLADSFAEKEFAKFRTVQDRNQETDFSKWVRDIKSTGQIPTESQMLSETESYDKEGLQEYNSQNHNTNKEKKSVIKKKGRIPKPTTQICPNCGKENDLNDEYCEGNIEIDGDIKPCGYTF